LEEKNRFLPGLFTRDTGADRLTDLDRHDCSAVAYGMVDRGHVLRYGHHQSSHCHRSASHLTASRIARGEGAKETIQGRVEQAGKGGNETLQGRVEQAGKRTIPEKQRESIAIFSLISFILPDFYRKRAQKAPVFQAGDEWAFLSGWLGCGE
jgi:hypothetical protein